MNHKPTRDILGEPVYYSQRDLIAEAVCYVGALLFIALVTVAWFAIYGE